jgi:hypothetical protein
MNENYKRRSHAHSEWLGCAAAGDRPAALSRR